MIMFTIENRQGGRLNIYDIKGNPDRIGRTPVMRFTYGNNRPVQNEQGKSLAIKVNTNCPLVADEGSYREGAFDGLKIESEEPQRMQFIPVTYSESGSFVDESNARDAGEVTFVREYFTLRACGGKRQCAGCALNPRAKLDEFRGNIEDMRSVQYSEKRTLVTEYEKKRTGKYFWLAWIDRLMINMGRVPNAAREIAEVNSVIHDLTRFIDILKPAS